MELYALPPCAYFVMDTVRLVSYGVKHLKERFGSTEVDNLFSP